MEALGVLDQAQQMIAAAIRRPLRHPRSDAGGQHERIVFDVATNRGCRPPRGIQGDAALAAIGR